MKTGDAHPEGVLKEVILTRAMTQGCLVRGLIFGMLVAALLAQPMAEPAEFKGQYLGQDRPGYRPELFAPLLFSTYNEYGFHATVASFFFASALTRLKRDTKPQLIQCKKYLKFRADNQEPGQQIPLLQTSCC